jgi:RimJ/RimL family protein N-acetyltransferase
VNLSDGRVVLRPWRIDDAPAVAAACQDPEIAHWIPVIPRPYTLADAETFLRDCVEAGDDRQAFAVTVAGTDEALGSMDMRINQFGTGHIGYWIAPEARGDGLCTRALRLISRWGFDERGLGRLELVTDPENHASQRVAEKAGFVREGILRSHIPHPDGRRRDSVMFSLLPGELLG